MFTMSLKNILGLLIAILIATVSGKLYIDNQNLRNQLIKQEETLTSEGSVFIVTKGSENVKLGAVQVYVYPINEIQDFFAKVKNELAFAPEKLPQAQANLEQIKSAILASVPQEALKVTISRATPHFCRWNIFVPFGNKPMRVYSNKCNKPPSLKVADVEWLCKLYEKHINLCGEYNSRKNIVSAIEYEIQHPKGPLNYFFALPKPIVTVETDADGKFKLNLSRNAVYGIVAATHRSIGENDEKYFWAIKFNPTLSKTINLTNNNLTTTDSPASILRTEKP